MRLAVTNGCFDILHRGHAEYLLAARRTADVLLVLGTSLTVFPAAGLPRLTLQRGGKVFIVNAQPTSLDDYAAACYPDLAAFSDSIASSSVAASSQSAV